MKKIIAVVVVLVFVLSVFIPTLDAQATNFRADTTKEQLFFSTVRIEIEKLDAKGNPSLEISTGFIVRYRWTMNNAGDFLVTTKHSVKGAVKGRFIFTRSYRGQPVLGETYNMEFKDFEKMWYENPDPRIDVAVMPLAGVLKEVEKRGWEIFYKTISEDISIGYGREKQLDAIEEVIFIGYPSGLMDTKNFLPVARRGITATPLTIDYSGLPQFLIDAAVFPGSSGSPVFIANTGSYTNRAGRLILGNRIIFLGMISNIVIREESGTWSVGGVKDDDIPVVKTQQMIDIGIVFKAPVIFDTIRQLIKKTE